MAYGDYDYPRIRTRDDLEYFLAELGRAKKKSDKMEVLLAWSYNDPDLFNTYILGRVPYWYRQREMCAAIVDHMTTLILSGNMVGKSFILSGILLWYSCTRPDSLVISTAPTANHLSRVLWRYVREADAKSLYPLGGKITSSPHELFQLGDSWLAVGLTSPKKEALSGFHGDNVMVCIDEASGIAPDAWEGLDSLGYDKLVAVGNPVRTDNRFFTLCEMAQVEGSRMKLLTIPSTESPDIDKPRGKLANRGWLEDMREKYGDGSQWWRSHVEAKWPTESTSTLFREDWLKRCVGADHIKAGPRRLSIDYAEGGGGDLAVILVRDDNGIYFMDWSNRWSRDELAKRVLQASRTYEVHPTKISWDASGTGQGFGDFLTGVGLVGCRPYKGSFTMDRNDVGVNLRSTAAWLASRRLDPERTRPVVVEGPQPDIWTPRGARGAATTKRTPLPAFAIPQQYYEKLRPELAGLRYEEVSNGKIKVESGEDYRDRLGRSPDFADSFCQSFAL